MLQRQAEHRRADSPGEAWLRRMARSRPVVEFLDAVWPSAGERSEFDILHGLNNLRKKSKLPRRGE